jgi:hypothetical protein
MNYPLYHDSDYDLGAELTESIEYCFACMEETPECREQYSAEIKRFAQLLDEYANAIAHEAPDVAAACKAYLASLEIDLKRLECKVKTAPFEAINSEAINSEAINSSKTHASLQALQSNETLAIDNTLLSHTLEQSTLYDMLCEPTPVVSSTEATMTASPTVEATINLTMDTPLTATPASTTAMPPIANANVAPTVDETPPLTQAELSFTPNTSNPRMMRDSQLDEEALRLREDARCKHLSLEDIRAVLQTAQDPEIVFDTVRVRWNQSHTNIFLDALRLPSTQDAPHIYTWVLSVDGKEQIVSVYKEWKQTYARRPLCVRFQLHPADYPSSTQCATLTLYKHSREVVTLQLHNTQH